MKKDLIELLNVLDEKNHELSLAVKEVKKLDTQIKENDKLIFNLEKLKELIIKLGEQTQEEAFSYIEETITLALQSVYGTEYSFEIVSETKRDQQEITFSVNKGGLKLEPRQDSLGGGVIDICSLALRMVMWTLERNSSCPIIILDEPFKNVSSQYREKASQMIKTISDMLNIQIIMVTHMSEYIDCSDNVIEL